ncbi:HEAT repeat domain-containing protein [candidate division KSB1 bacterium]
MKKLKIAKFTAWFIAAACILSGLNVFAAVPGQRQVLRQGRSRLILPLGNHLYLNTQTGKLLINPGGRLQVTPMTLARNLALSNYQDADAKAYRKAYNLVLNEKWPEAREAMNEFKKNYPESRRISSAEYWICVTYEKLDYPGEQVFRLYEDFIKEYANSSWVDDARSNMVRIGSELIRSGNREYEVKVQDIRRESDEALALAALYALGTDNEEEVLPQVIEMYDNTASERIRKELVYILARFKSKAASDKLLDIILNNPDSDIFSVSIHGLSEKEYKELPEIMNRIIWNETNEELIKSAVYSLPNIKMVESDNMLIKIVGEHPNPEIRKAAIHMLSDKQMRDPKVVKIMEGVIFNSDNIELKKTALYGLVRSENKKKDELIVKVLKSSEEPEVRNTAIHCLSEKAMRDPELLNIIEDIILNDKDLELQKTAAYSLMRSDNPDIKEILINVLKVHKNPVLRKIAIEGLPETAYKDENLMKILEDIIFNSDDSSLQKTALYSLSRINNAITVQLLANVIKSHNDPDVRKTALYSIPNARTFQVIFPALSEIIFKGQDEELQKAAIYTMIRMDNKESRNLISEIITGHNNPAIQLAALHSISAKNINDELVKNLESIAVNSANEELQKAALHSIMRYDKKRYNELVIRMVEEKKDAELIMYAMQFLDGAVGILPGKDVVTLKFLEDIIFSESKSSLREQTIYMIGKKETDESLDLLIKIAKTHEDTKIRKAAVMVLGRSKDPKAKEALLEIIKKQ